MNAPLPPIVPSPAGAPPAPVVPVAPQEAAPAVTPDAAKEEHNTRIPLPPGAIVGDYTIISKLGKGGFGITYRARHTDSGSTVVIKEHIPEGMAMRMADGHTVISVSPEKEEAFRQTMAEFMEEASVLMGLEHPGIVPILTAFEANGTAYYSMPFVEGSPLRIPEQATLDRTRKASEARKIKQQLHSLLFTLEYLEQHNIVHRDIKPENIIVNEESRPILLDFGTARQLQSGKVFNNIYTPDFCAPEQSTSRTDAEMSSRLSARTDIYALGACFYYLITRLLPPRADMRVHAEPDPYKPLAGRKDLLLYYPAYFLQSIDRALSLDPAERWQDASTWRLCTESGIVPPPRSVMLRMRIYMAIAVCIIMVLGGLSILAWREKSQTQKMYINGLNFTEGLLHDFNTALSDLPGATQLQSKLGTNLKNYLNSMEGLPVADDARLQRSMASAWQNLGAVYVQQGKLADATDSYRKATALLETLYESDDEDLRTRFELARTLANRAEIARRRNMITEGRDLSARALTLLQEVCAAAPNNPDYLCSLGEAMDTAARLADNSGEMEQRRKALEDMLGLYRKLVNEYPNHETSRRGLAQAQIHLASLYMDSNDFTTTETLLTESKDILNELSETSPQRLSFRQALSSAYFTLGEMNKRKGLSETNPKNAAEYLNRAQTAFEQCINIARQLETMDRDNAEYPFDQCKALTHLADITMSREEYNKAEHYSRDALSRINNLLEKAPNNADYAQIRAGLLRSLAITHSRQESEKARATAEFAEYREIVRSLLEQSPNNPMLKYMYADALTESSVHARNMGDEQSARQWLSEAELLLDKLSPKGKTNTIWANKLKSVQSMLREITEPLRKN